MSLKLIISTAITTCILFVGLGLSLAGIIQDALDCQSNAANVCTWHRPQIWSLILQAVVGIGTLAAIATDCASKAHTSVVGFLVLAGIFTLQHAQEIGRGVDDFTHIGQVLSSVGFLVLFLWDLGLVVFLGVTRGLGSASGMRREVNCPIVSYALFLKFAFAVLLGCFMVGASILGAKSDCGGGVDQVCSVGLKWGTGAFALLVMVVLALCELLGIVEGYEAVLGAAVAVAASLVMDLTSSALPAADTKGAVEAAGFIILSASCLCALVALGVASTKRAVAEELPWLKAVRAAFWYSLLPLLFGWALSVAGVAKYSECSDCSAFPGMNLTYWTLVFEMISIILAAIGKQFRLRQLRLPSILFIVLATVNIMRLIDGCMNTNELWLSMAAAGFMLVATMNCVVTVLLGLEDDTANAGFLPLVA